MNSLCLYWIRKNAIHFTFVETVKIKCKHMSRKENWLIVPSLKNDVLNQLQKNVLNQLQKKMYSINFKRNVELLLFFENIVMFH